MLNTGVFPTQLKISKVIPKYKSKDHTLLSNYRPIAVIPSISKIFEYVFLEQLSKYFIQNNLLSSQQYGFRAKHLTELAALNLVDHLTYKLDSGNIPTNIYIDLSKAFDTLTHSILLDTMSFYGVNGVAYDLLKFKLSYTKTASSRVQWLCSRDKATQCGLVVNVYSNQIMIR